MSTKIQWTDETVNAVIGCSKCSTGCNNCYAEKMAIRQWWMRDRHDNPYRKVMETGYSGQPTGWNGKTAFVETALQKPFRLKKPKKIFWSSMGDMFHTSVPIEWIDRCFAVMALTPQHIHQVLTKRPERMAEYVRDVKVPDNVWLGTTVETQEVFDKRISYLLECQAAIRFLSVEPMLSKINIMPFITSIDWVICGGESGTGKTRACYTHWVKYLRNQCEDSNVPFFFKQWGAFQPGNSLDGKQYLEFPLTKGW